MKIINIAVIVLILTLSNSILFSGEPDKKIHQKCIYPTIMIKCSDTRAIGSAVIVRSEKVGDEYHNVAITAAHVVRDSTKAYAYSGVYKNWSTYVGENKYLCKTYVVDHSLDLAIVLFPSDKKMPVATIDFDPEIYIGNKVCRVGCGMGEQFRLDYGRITSVNITLPQITKIKNWYRTSIPCVPGDSGGPVYHEYKVIGIVSCIRSLSLNSYLQIPIPEMSYIVPINRVKIMDEKIDKKADFVYNQESRLPVIPYFFMKMESTKVERVE